MTGLGSPHPLTITKAMADAEARSVRGLVMLAPERARRRQLEIMTPSGLFDRFLWNTTPKLCVTNLMRVTKRKQRQVRSGQ
jgi:hypothetical protein